MWQSLAQHEGVWGMKMTATTKYHPGQGKPNVASPCFCYLIWAHCPISCVWLSQARPRVEASALVGSNTWEGKGREPEWGQSSQAGCGSLYLWFRWPNSAWEESLQHGYFYIREHQDCADGYCIKRTPGPTGRRQVNKRCKKRDVKPWWCLKSCQKKIHL